MQHMERCIKCVERLLGKCMWIRTEFIWSSQSYEHDPKPHEQPITMDCVHVDHAFGMESHCDQQKQRSFESNTSGHPIVIRILLSDDETKLLNSPHDSECFLLNCEYTGPSHGSHSDYDSTSFQKRTLTVPRITQNPQHSKMNKNRHVESDSFACECSSRDTMNKWLRVVCNPTNRINLYGEYLRVIQRWRISTPKICKRLNITNIDTGHNKQEYSIGVCFQSSKKLTNDSTIKTFWIAASLTLIQRLHGYSSLPDGELPLHKQRSEFEDGLRNSTAPFTRKRHVRSTHSNKMNLIKGLKHAVTFKDATGYLTIPPLRLYDQFSLRFAIRTSQTDALLLFNSGPYGVDFIAFEMRQSRIYFIFDMGSGTQKHQLSNVPINDSTWHSIEVNRVDVNRNILRTILDGGTRNESIINIPVLHGDRSKNFDLAGALYVGGIPEWVFREWQEKINIRYGFQGCIANFSVNNKEAYNMMSMANEYKWNNSTNRKTSAVVSGCVQRPQIYPRCSNDNSVQRMNSGATLDPKGIDFQRRVRKNEAVRCMNGGFCIEMWSTIKCSCELTTFQGDRCDNPGTTLAIGITGANILSSDNASATTPISDYRSQGVGYLRLSYTDKSRNTRREEFVLAIQTNQSSPSPRLLGRARTMSSSVQVATLLYISNAAQTGDYLHLYLKSGFIRLDCDFGGGLIHVMGPRIRLDDGYFHRIRGLRDGSHLLLEVDGEKVKKNVQGRFGKQFNNQENIWIGHAPILNTTDFYRGYISEDAMSINRVLCDWTARCLIFSWKTLYRLPLSLCANASLIAGRVLDTSAGPRSVILMKYNSSWKCIGIGIYYNGLLLNDLAAGLAYQAHVHVMRYGRVKHMTEFPVKFAVGSPFQSLIKKEAKQKPHGNWSQTPADSATGDKLQQQDAQSDADYSTHSTRKTPSNGPFSFQFENTQSTSHTVQTTKRAHTVYEQVNIWLLVCLAGAGCVMLCSLTFLAYRFHLRNRACRHPCSKCVTDTETKLSVRASSPIRTQLSSCASKAASETRRTATLERSSNMVNPMNPIYVTDSSLGLIGSSIGLTVNRFATSGIQQSQSSNSAEPLCCPVHSPYPSPVVYVDVNYLAQTLPPWEREKCHAVHVNSIPVRSSTVVNPLVHSVNSAGQIIGGTVQHTDAKCLSDVDSVQGSAMMLYGVPESV